MEAFDQSNTRVGYAKGNWIDLSAGKPDPRVPLVKVRTLKPNREEHGLEIAGKFRWGRPAWIAGEKDPPVLGVGEYLIRATLTDARKTVTVFEWRVVNPGADQPLEAEPK